MPLVELPPRKAPGFWRALELFLKTMLPRRPAMVPPKMARRPRPQTTIVTGALKAKGPKGRGWGGSSAWGVVDDVEAGGCNAGQTSAQEVGAVDGDGVLG